MSYQFLSPLSLSLVLAYLRFFSLLFHTRSPILGIFGGAFQVLHHVLLYPHREAAKQLSDITYRIEYTPVHRYSSSGSHLFILSIR